ncbi:bacterial transcriptional activator domain-containing protein [Streptomyces avermitilis]|uniref:AfsR/SARP family transcriptional regulator n=1 Tax=Streptomyces avermitilis TaxID=33903 RepID=UPI0033B0DD2B
MNRAPTLPYTEPLTARRPLGGGTARHTQHAVQCLLEQAEYLDLNSPIATLTRWRAAALVVIRSICGPHDIAWQILRPEATWFPATMVEASKRELAFAEGWAITLGVLEGLLPTLMEAESGPATPEADSVGQQDDPDDWPAIPFPRPSTGLNLVLLGAPQVRGAQGPVESKRRSRLTEYAIWLYLNPGSDRHALDAALWPGQRVRADSRNTAMSRLRAWLGSDHFPTWSPETGYALTSLVTSDWGQFKELAARGENDGSQAGTRNLRAALELVSGPPFADVIGLDSYAWAEPYASEMSESIVGVARRLTHRYLEGGDLPGARWSVRRGYQALPGGLQQFQVAAEAVREPYSEPDGLRHLADQLTHMPVPLTRRHVQSQLG